LRLQSFFSNQNRVKLLPVGQRCIKVRVTILKGTHPSSKVISKSDWPLPTTEPFANSFSYVRHLNFILFFSPHIHKNFIWSYVFIFHYCTFWEIKRKRCPNHCSIFWEHRNNWATIQKLLIEPCTAFWPFKYIF